MAPGGKVTRRTFAGKLQADPVSRYRVTARRCSTDRRLPGTFTVQANSGTTLSAPTVSTSNGGQWLTITNTTQRVEL